MLASTGKQMVLGGSIYFRHVNAQGGVHGQKIAVKVLDDGYKVDDTVRLTRELLADPELVALFGFVYFQCRQAAERRRAGTGGAALVAPYTGGEPLRNPFNPWIFHVRAGYADETEHMVQQVTTLGMTRIGVMYQDDGFGKAYLEGVQKALIRRQLELSAAAPYDRNTDNVDAAVQQIMKSDAGDHHDCGEQTVVGLHQRYREAGGGAQLYNISVVDPAEIVKLADLKNAWPGHQPGGAFSVPAQPARGARIPDLAEKYAPDEHINYTSFEEFLGAKVLVEGCARARADTGQGHQRLWRAWATTTWAGSR